MAVPLRGAGECHTIKKIITVNNLSFSVNKGLNFNTERVYDLRELNVLN